MNTPLRKGAGRRPLLSGALVFALALGAGLPACSAAEKKTDEPALARVNGKTITEADLKQTASSQFAQLERQYQQQRRELIEGALEQAINDRLVEAEAAARKVTKEQLLAEVKPAEVTDADVDSFYEQNKAQIPRPKEQVAAQIKQYLQGQRQAEAEQSFYKTLEAKYKVEHLIEPDRVQVAANGPAQGPANAPITIVEFSDFQCPYCAKLIPTLDQVKAQYGDKVRIVFRQFPLNFHQFAQKAAEASLCANEQGKFWELHDAMFENQQALAVDALKAKAAELGVKAETFNACLDSGKYASQVQADMQEGTEAGVTGTPAMFVNGRFINGAVPLEQVTKVIDDELRRKGVATTTASK
ncbi:MAG TPA: thioredoxin domain-containing protein [Thermoanaerobaculia bacterium]|nr:thioredoxin domain-containing protein [Thermoanaerobaculia bacterium]